MFGEYTLLFSGLVLIAAFVVARKLFFGGRNVKEALADVTAICFHQLDGLWSPEIEIQYSFKLESYSFIGKGFMRIDDVFEDDSILLSDHKGFLTLSTNRGELLGEEHIEAFLMQVMPQVEIEYNERNPLENRILNIDNERKQMFQSFSIDFPWNNKE